MKVAIIKYNAGNIRSVDYALQRLGINSTITDNKEEILSADKVIFPGVGEASSAMKYLKDKELDVLIKNLKQPVLGICLGMQLLCSWSEEGNTDGLGIFDMKVKKFIGAEKVPHMGWNNITKLTSSLFNAIPESTYFYFVHSYYASTGENTIAQTNYINDFSASLHKNNFYGVQFHPEKSGAIGSKVLENFLKL
jgi:imidazole glycerol-phosphate synthase subunit HisH